MMFRLYTGMRLVCTKIALWLLPPQRSRPKILSKLRTAADNPVLAADNHHSRLTVR